MPGDGYMRVYYIISFTFMFENFRNKNREKLCKQSKQVHSLPQPVLFKRLAIRHFIQTFIN